MTDSPPTFRVKRKSHRKPIEFPIVVETTETVDNPEDPDGEPVTRDVEVTHTFHAKGTCPGDILLDVAASMTKEGGWQAAAIRGLFEYAIVDDEKERWQAFLRDVDSPDITELGDIADWLLEQYGNRPTSGTATTDQPEDGSSQEG